MSATFVVVVYSEIIGLKFDNAMERQHSVDAVALTCKALAVAIGITWPLKSLVMHIIL